jgi:hypothetical protein
MASDGRTVLDINESKNRIATMLPGESIKKTAVLVKDYSALDGYNFAPVNHETPEEYLGIEKMIGIYEITITKK